MWLGSLHMASQLEQVKTEAREAGEKAAVLASQKTEMTATLDGLTHALKQATEAKAELSAKVESMAKEVKNRE